MTESATAYGVFGDVEVSRAMERAAEGAVRTRRQQAAAREEQILDVAVKLFAQQGFAGTTTRQIAHEVGVTEGLIFHYFPSKALLLQAAAAQRTKFVVIVQDLLDSAKGLPAREVLEQIVLGWVDAIRGQGDLVTMLVIESQSNEDLNEVFRSLVGAMVSRLGQYLDARIKAGELRPGLQTTTSAMMFFSSLMFFFLSHRQLPDTEWRKQATAFTHEMLETWFHGALVTESRSG